MKRLIHVSRGRAAVLYLFILLSFGLLGCAGVGNLVPVDYRIPFGEKSSNEGRFNRWGLTVDYSYRLAGGNMTLDGQVYYPAGADSLNVSIQFLDAGGIVLEQKLVYSSGFRVSDRMSERTFKETLVVPAAATGMTFNYYAKARSNRR